MSVSPEIIEAVFQMARLGLTVIAQNRENGPSVVAKAASDLEEWRLDMAKYNAARALVEPKP